MSDLESAISLGQRYLVTQADTEFVEARHEMVFPRWAGFRSTIERQSSDIFARAVLGSLCLDLAEIAADRPQAAWIELARREADYVAGARLADRDGGWSYFPDLPELPPDLDSLSAVLYLFSRSASQHLPLCEEPIRWALADQATDGSLKTWIVAPTNPPAQKELMHRGIKRFWGNAVDVEVCARFLLALEAMDSIRFADAIHRGAEFIRSQQQPSGLWTATWYWGEIYGTALCLHLLRKLAAAETAVSRAVDAVCRLQREDGGWGIWESVSLDTALAIWVIIQFSDPEPHGRLIRAVSLLLQHQALDGSWPASPWIKMNVGRATGRTSNTLTYQSRTVTTAFALRSLMQVRQRCER